MMTLHIFSGERAVGQLTLPLPPDDFKQKLDDIRGKNQAVKPLYVFNVDGPIPGLGWHLEFTKLEQDAALQKLNQLAETLGHLGTGGLLQLNKVLHTDYRQDLDAILRTASSIRKVNPNSYEFIPDVTTDQALGKWLVEHGQFKAEDYLRPHLNYDSIGFEYRHAHVTVSKEGKELTFKAPADNLTGHRNYYNTSAIPARDRQEFERLFGLHADYRPEEITKITYGRSTIYRVWRGAWVSLRPE